MKKILISLMVIALVGGIVGAAFADFSDIETSRNNTFATGALDLKVSNSVGTEYEDPNVPMFFDITDAVPCCDKSVFFDLHNYGQGFQVTPPVYLHVKNLSCGWVVPKVVYKWVDAQGNTVPAPSPLPQPGDRGTGFPRPLNEPEYVAEYGGIAGENAAGLPVTVPGVGGNFGEDCQVSRHLTVYIQVAGPYEHDQYTRSDQVPQADWTNVDLSAYDTDPADGVVKLNEIVCKQVHLADIPGCKKIWVHMSLHLQDIDEDALFTTGFFDETIPAEAKWDHWPTNALQKDYTKFDMAFELLQYPIP